jgi:hypothetical protein
MCLFPFIMRCGRIQLLRSSVAVPTAVATRFVQTQPVEHSLGETELKLRCQSVADAETEVKQHDEETGLKTAGFSGSSLAEPAVMTAVNQQTNRSPDKPELMPQYNDETKRKTMDPSEATLGSSGVVAGEISCFPSTSPSHQNIELDLRSVVSQTPSIESLHSEPNAASYSSQASYETYDFDARSSNIEAAASDAGLRTAVPRKKRSLPLAGLISRYAVSSKPTIAGTI